MTPDEVADLKAGWCSSLEVVKRASDEFQIRSPFAELDGDELSIFLVKKGDAWELTDRGHTASHLGLEEFDFTQARSERLSRIVAASGMLLSLEAAVVLQLDTTPTATDVADFVQVLSQIRALPSFEAPRDIERFVATGRDLVARWVPEGLRELGWRHPSDVDKAFPVDVHLGGVAKFEGLELFIVGNAEKADRSSNVLTQLRDWSWDTPALAVVAESVERKSVVRLRTRFGTENVLTTTFDRWDGLYEELVNRNAPVMPAEPEA